MTYYSFFYLIILPLLFLHRNCKLFWFFSVYNMYCYITRLSVSKTSIVIGWFLVKCPPSNSIVSRLGYNWAVVVRAPHVVSAWLNLKWLDLQHVLTPAWLLNFVSHSKEARGPYLESPEKAFVKLRPQCLFCKAGLFICCKGNKNKSNCKVSCFGTP